MHTKTTILLALSLTGLFLCNSSLIAQQSTISTILLNESKLSINGTSNVTDFECVYEEELESDTLNYELEIKDSDVLVKGDQLRLLIDSFDCGKRAINKDFRNTLKSSSYPNIDVQLMKVYSTDGVPTIAEVSIGLAGVQQIYQVQLHELDFNGGITTVLGEQKLKMTDFNLTPPRALFGLIKVRDELVINFTLSVVRT